jgi:hypothetical protein
MTTAGSPIGRRLPRLPQPSHSLAHRLYRRRKDREASDGGERWRRRGGQRLARWPRPSHACRIAIASAWRAASGSPTAALFTIVPLPVERASVSQSRRRDRRLLARRPRRSPLTRSCRGGRRRTRGPQPSPFTFDVHTERFIAIAPFVRRRVKQPQPIRQRASSP